MRHLNLSFKRRSARLLSAFVPALMVGLFLPLALGAQETAPPPPADTQQQAAPPADAQQTPPTTNDVRAVRLSDVEGRVQVFAGSEQAFDQAQPNMPAVEGMRLVTASDGRVEVQFEDGSVARVTPNSSITLTELHRNGDGSTVTTIDANAGLTYYELNGRAGQYAVRFGAVTVTPVDSSIFRVTLDQNPEIAVTHGAVHVSDDQNLALDVHTNQSVQFNAPNSTEYGVAQSVAANSWDQWNSDRDQTLATLDESATVARASTGNPDDPGWSDLDYYGNWYDVPGYGQAWAPSGVGAGFDPFGVGSWGYYSSVGYTWISGYPWGWWPYHCGAWNYFNTFGWLWFPGNCGWGSYGVGWYPYATVWRVPAGYRLPVRPLPPHGLPPHGPTPHPEPVIVVNRTPDALQQFRAVGQAKPEARSFEYDGQMIRPAQNLVHLHTGGPLGEGFTASAERTQPGLLNMPRQNRTAYPGFGNTVRNGYQPANRGFELSGSRPAGPSNSRPAWNGGSGNSGARPSESPHFSAPAAPPPAPASHPSGPHR